jgi:hypothetical protein
MGGFVVLWIIVGPLLLWAIASPRSVWQVTRSWQYRDPDAVEPSDTTYAICRWGSVAGLIVLAIITATIVTGKH